MPIETTTDPTIPTTFKKIRKRETLFFLLLGSAGQPSEPLCSETGHVFESPKIGLSIFFPSYRRVELLPGLGGGGGALAIIHAN
jgi:hypothetical protein